MRSSGAVLWCAAMGLSLPLAVSASPAFSPSSSSGGRFVSMDAESGMFLEPATGRQLTLHGVNVCPKLAPFLPTSDSTDLANGFGAADMENLRRWGMNMVRLCVMWEGVMPQPGVVNSTYLGLVHTLVDTLYEDYGIYTLIDAHQDTLNGRLCGEGMPTWAFDKALELAKFDANNSKLEFPAPLGFELPKDPESGMPSLDACMNHSFFDYYLTFESQAAWKSLYTQSELHADFAQAWAAVATEFKDSPGVLGYELLNEPWAGLTDHPASDAKSLLPLYEVLVAAIRGVDVDHLIFFEPLATDSYLGILGDATDFPAGGIPVGNLTSLKAPKSPSRAQVTERADPNQVYTYHIYWPPQSGNISQAELEALKLYIALDWKGETKSLDHVQLGGFMSEFGAIADDPVSMELVEFMLSNAADRHQGWSYWTYKSFNDITTQNQHTETFFNEDGSLQALKVKVLGSGYPRVVAGQLQHWSFHSGGAVNNGTGTLVVEYTPSSAAATSEFHVGVPSLHCNGKSSTNPSNAIASSSSYGSCSIAVTPAEAVGAEGIFLGVNDTAGTGIVARVSHIAGFTGNITVEITDV